MTKILIQNPDRFLPITSPWETAGGSAEQSTILFLRGCILSSFGMVEMQLKQIAFGCSKREEYSDLKEKAPRNIKDFLKYISRVANADGPVQNSGVNVTEICRKFEDQLDIRNCWAHGHLVVLPGSGDQDSRWDGSWITLELFDRRQTEFIKNRWLHEEVEMQAEAAKELADECNLAFCALRSVVPMHVTEI